jgi:hypothetical protein
LVAARRNQGNSADASIPRPNRDDGRLAGTTALDARRFLVPEPRGRLIASSLGHFE